MSDDTELLARLERTYDAIPRVAGGRVEQVGPFDLFLREGPGWPWYARPRLGVTEVAVDDVEAVLRRQRELEIPEAIEWVLDVTPGLVEAIGSRMAVTLAPLMVLDPGQLPDPDPRAVLLDPDASDFAAHQQISGAVAAIAFSAAAGAAPDPAGTASDPAGPTQRDAAVRPVRPEWLEVVANGVRSGRTAEAVVVDPVDGIVARGAYQSALGAAEIVGVATLPSHRRLGHGAAVSALLARHALSHGNDLVFLSAADETVARVYARIGFRRIGTAGIAEPAHA
jgi:ribosomal protein S18 acetylase RimI-like enzyme